MAIGHWNDSVIDLIPGYRATKKMLEKVRDKNEIGGKETIGSMISDCNYVLEWLETGRRPGSTRGIERRSAYQRERPTDPIILQAYIRKTTAGGAIQVSTISDKDRDRIDKELSKLTDKERYCFERVCGDGLPYSEVAELLGVTKGTVQWFVESAKEKLKKGINQMDIFDFL